MKNPSRNLYPGEESLAGGGREPRFAIITTAANDLMRPIHSRMPVILDEEEERAWLERVGRFPDLIGLLETPPTLALRAYEVSRAVNRASLDVPELIKPGVAFPLL